MKALIDKEGTLVLQPESETEIYAAFCWLENHSFTTPNNLNVIPSKNIKINNFAKEKHHATGN